MKSFNYSFVRILLSGTFVLSSFYKNNDYPISNKTPVSEASFDDYITNSNVKEVSDFHLSGTEYKRISIGWNEGGYALWGFLRYEISNILSARGNKLVADNAILTTYEADTNLEPFFVNKLILKHLTNYKNSLDTNNYDVPDISNLEKVSSVSKAILSGSSTNITILRNNYNLSNSGSHGINYGYNPIHCQTLHGQTLTIRRYGIFFWRYQGLTCDSNFCPKLNP